MIIIAKNTTLTSIVLTDLEGYALLPDTPIDLATLFNIYDIARSDILLLKVADGSVSINNGETDLNIATALRYVNLIPDNQVIINNQSAEPVPVDIQNTAVSVSGDVSITGTPSVDINGVTLSDGALPVNVVNTSVPISGDVGITGTPSFDINGVTLSDGSLPVTGTIIVGNSTESAIPISGSVVVSELPEISGTVIVGNEITSPIPVSVQGNPSVDIHGLTLASGTLPVSGTITVGNAVGSPVPISVQGTPSFNINGTTLVDGAVPVNFSNTSIGISGTPNVSVTNTPSVNINGATLISGAVPVNVTNTAVPVSGSVGITGTPTVGISGVTTSGGTVPVSGALNVSMQGTASITFSPDQTDMYDRLRVTNPEVIYKASFAYDELPYEWDTITSGTASFSHVDAEDAIYMTIGTASGDSIIRQTKSWYRFQQGYSTIALFVATFQPKTNVVQRVGYYADDAGIFFQHNGVTLAVGERSSVTGSVVDTIIARADWNMDKMDGTGASGVNVDATKIQQFVIEFQGLSGGRVRYGFNVNGNVHYCHQIYHYNLITQPFAIADGQPLRFEIRNTGVSASSTTLQQYKSALLSDGAVNILGAQRGMFIATRGTASRQVTTTVLPLVSLRASSTFKGKTSHVLIAPVAVVVFSLDIMIQYFVYKNATLTGANWVDVATGVSAAQQDITATSLSGGVVIGGGFIADSAFKTSGTAASDNDMLRSAYITCNYAGVSDVVTVAAKSFGSNANVTAAISFKEIY
jgi:hypothetical protein